MAKKQAVVNKAFATAKEHGLTQARQGKCIVSGKCRVCGKPGPLFYDKATDKKYIGCESCGKFVHVRTA
jgi:hypothetical protein